MREFISFQQKHGSRGSWNYQGAASPICFVTLKHLSVLGVPVTIKQTEDVTAHTAHSLLWGTVTKSCVLLLTLLSSESLLCDVCQLIWIYDKQGFGISPPIWISEYSFFSAEIQQPPSDKREEQRKLRVNVMASVQMCAICDPKWKAERRGQSRGQTWLASNSLDQQAYHLCFSSPHSHLLIWPPMLIRKMEMEPSF